MMLIDMQDHQHAQVVACGINAEFLGDILSVFFDGGP